MEISFRIHYKTAWGENLRAVLSLFAKGGQTQLFDIPLSTKDGLFWTGKLNLSLTHTAAATYHYEVFRQGQLFRQEWHALPRTLVLNPTAKTYFVRDTWRDLPDQAYLYSSAVTDVFRKRAINFAYIWPISKRTLVLRAQTPRPHTGQALYLCGEGNALGNWNPDQARAFTETTPNEWTLVLNTDQLLPQSSYKLLIKGNGETLWEEGKNRTLPEFTLEQNEIWVQDDLRPKFAENNPVRAAGVVLPVFSLRSEDGWGVGDFADLVKLIDWAQQTGQKVIQILPINDTTITHTWQDSYPYNAVSVYAFHPIYADLNALPGKASFKQDWKRRSLNALPEIDYEKTLALKLERLRDAFELEGEKTLQSQDFRTFFVEQLHWLPSYAMFCTLRDRYHTADFNTWPRYSKFSYRDVVNFCKEDSPDYKEVSFWYYVQFVLHQQLLAAVQKARKKGIILKGDIPIGISPTSVEAWMEPRLFNLNAQAGAPPDDFSATGQNWGFPTYNWEAMAQDGYRWWVRRFTHMAHYFDAYRIDHVLGFFRIWEIPAHSVQGLLGQFSPALPMDAKEINRFGLQFKQDFLVPCITESYLQEKLGDQAEKAKKLFLTPTENGRYQLKKEYNTQRKIEKFLSSSKDKKEKDLLNGMYALVSNVLFVEDSKQPGKYHPRISALTDGYFKTLKPSEQKAFKKLYNDYFYRRHNTFWAEQALQKLPALTQATRLLACAEDLGMIPACVPAVLNKLQILSLEIERMPKDPGTDFADTRTYPYTSVATPSTHDMSVLRAWWKENATLTQKFWREVLHKEGPAPLEADPKTCEEILRLHLTSPSMLTLISYQDWTSIDENLRAKNPDEERINVPANPRHYWRYRMPLSLEKLLQREAFNHKIKHLIEQSGR